MLKNWATIALTHWNLTWQEFLKDDIIEILEHFGRNDVKVIIPELFSQYDVITWETTYSETKQEFDEKLQENLVNEEEKIYKNKKDSEKKSTKSKYRKAPQFPINVFKESERLKLKTKEDSGEEMLLEELRNENNLEIEKIREIKNDLAEKRENYIRNYLKSKLEQFWKINSWIWKLSKSQKLHFYEEIDKEINRRKSLNSKISVLGSNILEIDDLYQEILLYLSNLDSSVNNKETIIDLNNKISKLKEEINETWNNLSKFKSENKEKTRANSKKVKDFNKKIESKKKKISELEKEINNINIEINYKLSFVKRLKLYSDIENYSKIDDFFNNLWIENIEENLRQLCDDAISYSKDEIERIKLELKKYIDIDFQKQDLMFWWRNLYEELLENDEININRLKELMKESWLFSQWDLDYLNSKLVILLEETDNKKIVWAKNKLKKFFKFRQDYNEDLSNNSTSLIEDIKISLGDLNDQILSSLSFMFEEEYYREFILPEFDIYYFLKYKKYFDIDFLSKFNLLKLKWILDGLWQYDIKIQELETLQWILDALEIKNKQEKSLEELSILFSLIDGTRQEIEKVLS